MPTVVSQKHGAMIHAHDAHAGQWTVLRVRPEVLRLGSCASFADTAGRSSRGDDVRLFRLLAKPLSRFYTSVAWKTRRPNGFATLFARWQNFSKMPEHYSVN